MTIEECHGYAFLNNVATQLTGGDDHDKLV